VGPSTHRAASHSPLFRPTYSTWNLSTGETTTAGLRFHAYVPGGGVVLLDAGRLVVADGEIVFEAGPHQLIRGDVEQFSAFLAG
jgi:hypothetical protein